MSFNPNLNQGQVVTNEVLRKLFRCSTQGGMRRSKKTNTLVIVSDHTRGIYVDRWAENILQYTGEGLTGDQKIRSRQNKTLSESDKNGVDVFLFEVYEEKQYIFQGQVQLAGTPYQETQPDKNDHDRKVWIFPLKLVGGGIPAPVTKQAIEKNVEKKQRKARKLSNAELSDRAKKGRKTPGSRTSTTTQYERDPYVIEYSKRRAKGTCDLCGQPAPFRNKNGEPFLETHHITWLSKGGDDTIENTVALCPNCHSKMHVLDESKDKAVLIKKASVII